MQVSAHSSSTSEEIKRTLAIKSGGPPSSLDALEKMLDQFDDLYDTLKNKMITDFSSKELQVEQRRSILDSFF